MLAICQFCFSQCISIQRERLIRLQIPVQNINIDIVFALLMDPDVGRHQGTFSGKLTFVLRTVSTSTISHHHVIAGQMV